MTIRVIAVSILLVLIAGTACAQSSTVLSYTIVIHGGAGNISRLMPDSIKQAYIASLRTALKTGQDVLAGGGTSLDAVEQVLLHFETDPKFNAGIGAVFTADSAHELDASIMDGRDLSCGAVAGVRHVPHPITLARLVMEKTQHVLLAGTGAEAFAEQQGIKLVPTSYFDTPERFRQLQRAQQKMKESKSGTVGCVAVDRFGNLAAGTTTGGMTNKMPGRIGDSPIIGAGNYANNKTCAVSGTGWGEKFIKNSVAFAVSSLMELKGMTVKEAAEEVVYKRLQADDGGLIALDAKGNYAMPFNAAGMFRGVANSKGVFDVLIWK